MSDQSIIYQFGEPFGSLCVLKNLTLKVTPPREFNDPFEFTPRMSHEFDSAIISKENIASAAAISGPPPADVEKIRASIRAYPEEIGRAFAPHFSELCRKTVRDYRQKVTDGFGVICFSHSRQSILMWSHYAAKHTGIVIGFDATHRVFSPLLEVSYRPDRLLFDPTQPVGGQYDEGFARELIRTKHKYWSYEEEARVMVRLSDLDPPTVGHEKQLYLMRIPRAAIKSITLGMRCSDKTEATVREAVKENGISVPIERTIPHDHEFEICFAPATA